MSKEVKKNDPDFSAAEIEFLFDEYLRKGPFDAKTQR